MPHFWQIEFRCFTVRSVSFSVGEGPRWTHLEVIINLKPFQGRFMGINVEGNNQNQEKIYTMTTVIEEERRKERAI